MNNGERLFHLCLQRNSSNLMLCKSMMVTLSPAIYRPFPFVGMNKL
uniref:Uncharacterized protein n=1 Tax=Anguilla anguilla TaxID=7936 RepID=A0A0E9R1M1_ANGAN